MIKKNTLGERDVDDIWGYYPNDLTKYPFSSTKL